MSSLPNFREVFVSRHGVSEGILVEFDFCQLEICALAELSKDAVLIEELNTGKDIHRLNAAAWVKCKPEEVTDAARKKAKILTFQLQYGAGAKKMAESLSIPAKEAKAFIDTYYNKYKGVGEYHAALLAHSNLCAMSANAQEDPTNEVMHYVCPITGRGYTFKIHKNESKHSWTGEKEYYFSPTEVKNYPVQGFATADIVPIVMNLILRKIQLFNNTHFPIGKPVGITCINTVHDSFMFDINSDYTYQLFTMVEEAFKEFPKYFKELFDYDLKVQYNYDVKFGADWSNSMTKLSRKEIQLLLEG